MRLERSNCQRENKIKKNLKENSKILTELLPAEEDKHGVISYTEILLTEQLFSPNWSNLVHHTHNVEALDIWANSQINSGSVSRLSTP